MTQLQRGSIELASAITKPKQTYQGNMKGLNDASPSGGAALQLTTSHLSLKASTARRRPLVAKISATRQHKETRKEIATNGMDTVKGFNAHRSDIEMLTASVANFSMLRLRLEAASISSV